MTQAANTNGGASFTAPVGNPDIPSVPVTRNYQYGFQYAKAFKTVQVVVGVATGLLALAVLYIDGALHSEEYDTYDSEYARAIIHGVSLGTAFVIIAVGMFLYWIIGVLGQWYENAAIAAQSVTEMRNLLYVREYEKGGLQGLHMTAASNVQSTPANATPAPSVPPVSMPVPASTVPPVSVPVTPVASAVPPVSPAAVPGVCAHCGKPLPANGRFCTGCGAPVPAPTSTPPLP